jgi:long-subunit acyl-CoA synthetase (AMP-forming)
VTPSPKSLCARPITADSSTPGFKADGFFITGDLGKIDGRGYVHIVGRGKDLIITG